MSDKPIGDLRRRMIADMTIRTFSEKTQRDYIRHVEAFASFLGHSPDTATGDDILFKASSETMPTIAADPKHLGARIGIGSVLHTWGSAMTFIRTST
jgi:hypothetical protein